MRLRSLELQGFKSFPDKTRLSFDSGITAVVGPNGSGKSNIADAMRWVLGEQSTKTLRGAKMEDVIFGGTQARKAVGYAAVQLVIDNSDKTLADQEDEITITRRLYRSGESEYRINGAQVRLKDIHEMLMDTGLGRDGYSIIGQGRISEIVSAKSAQRREIFEEAAGISKFRYRKEEAEKRLTQAEENLVRLRDILDELESRVGPLRVQAEKARSFLALAGEKKELEISLWMKSLEDLKERLSAQENKVDICKNEYEGLERESEALEAKLTAVYEEIRRLDMQVETRRSQIKEYEERLSRCEADIAVRHNDIRHNSESIARVEGDLTSSGAGLDELLISLQSKAATKADGAEELIAMAGRIQATEDRLAEQRAQVARLDSQLGDLGIRRESLEKAAAEIRLEQAANASVVTESLSRLESLRQSTLSHDSVTSELQEAVAECELRLAEQEELMASLANSRRGYDLKRESRGRKLTELESGIKQLEDEAAQKLQRARLLEDLESNMEGFAGSVKYILAQAAKGSIAGIYGAVSSLVSTRDETTTAIETALGPALQNIVVESEDIAKRGIRMLQSAKAGRATFLPVSTVKGSSLDTRQYRDMEGFVGLASELVEYNPKFQGIISQLLGRVVVTEDLDAGTAIAKASGYRVRVVTLDGQVINAGGSFTGGSTVRSAGVLGRRTEIDRLKQAAAGLREKAASSGPERKALIEELASLDAAISGAAAELQTAQEEKVRLTAQRENLERNLVQARRNRELAEGELASLTERLERLRSGEATQATLLEELDGQTAALDRELESVRLRRENVTVGAESAAAALNDQKMALLAAQKDQEILTQDMARIQEQIDTAGTRAESLRAERERLEQLNEDIRGQITALEAEKEALRDSVASHSQDIAATLERRASLEAETTELRNRERDIATRREETSRELARLEERRHAVQAEYDGIITKLWDEYELTRSQAAEIAVELPEPDKASRRLGELRARIKALGTVNVDAIEEYAQVSERYEFLSGQVKDVETSKAQLIKLIGDLTKEMQDIFTDNFQKIAATFSKVFTQLFGGGKGELSLTDKDNVLESGVDIYVQPPGKVIKNLSLLSGGEQAFVAIAIYFAILIVKPAPFCILDEIEAALDDVNVTKYANYLRNLCDETQFIAITHRRGTMEEADVLYGVTMQEEGVSKLLELKVTEVEAKLGL